ncbi:hypothetical protein MKX01_000684 [Papaver californicum]|nr:hypothetical protein MKX01_000684 [Papaver californicum]
MIGILPEITSRVEREKGEVYEPFMQSLIGKETVNVFQYVYIGNHTTVWGSSWKDHQWGYKCCQQVTKNSYCTRTAVVEVVESTTDLMEANAASHPKRRTARFVDIEAFLGECFSSANLVYA